MNLDRVFVDHLQKTKKYKNLNFWDLWYIYQNELNKACFQRDVFVNHSARHVCESSTKDKEIQKFKFLRFMINLSKRAPQSLFSINMANEVFKDLTRSTAYDKILRDKAVDTAKNPKYDGYQAVLASMVYTCFDKKTLSGAVKNEIMQNKELTEKLYKPITRTFEKQKVYSLFIKNILVLISRRCN